MQQQETKIHTAPFKISWEDSDSDFESNDVINTDFADLLASEENGGGVREGSIVKGKVVFVNSDTITVDIGHKSDGEVQKNEFSPEELDAIAPGQDIEVYLDRFEDQEGNMVLSRQRAIQLRAWDRIALAFQNNEIVEGTILAKVKGGFAVDIGVKAFLPQSQVDIRQVKNSDRLVDGKLQFKIIKFLPSRNNIVLSRRIILEQEREKQRSSTMEMIKEGATLRGIIKSIMDYGAFIDLGGIDGLLYITEMSWGRVNHPTELFEIGQEIEVKVLKFDQERQRVSLGYKQLQPDPWESVANQYQVSMKTSGKVVSVTDFGAFVELEGGIEGLIHVSEMSWSKRIKHPSKLVQLGETVEVIVLAVDTKERRISLGMKQLEPNPWEVIKEKYTVGDIIRGKVRNITDFGVFVGIEDGIDGLIHISDISWTDRIKHPGDIYKKGDEVEAKVLQIDSEGEKFSLGVKQLTEDPWTKIAREHPPGSKGKGKVTKLADFGAFVELAPGVEGMIHVSELADENVAKVSDVVNEGDIVEFVVLATDHDERRFSLSRKAFLRNLEGEDLKQYIGTVAEPKTTLADAFSRANAEDKV